ncbi:deoxyhypusine hydroxylase [Folsomia candida]|uniref:deoxyhypusine hydroxylase n=1 Tax=Folsomia candida TaxID=158441 RepID=UPI000B903275|nr:deoxyhypusine hydroxylase [Folsomia candida]
MSAPSPKENVAVSEDEVKKLGEFLRNETNPLKARFRALFTLRNINNLLAIQQIGDCFSDPSALLKHELAYCLGQMQSHEAIPILASVLNNLEEHPMVRHEAAEALGAIGGEDCLQILKKYSQDKVTEVAETVELALARICHVQEYANLKQSSPYFSVDPAFPLKGCSDVELLTTMLMNEKLSLYQRYQAMFTLRDLATPESIEAIGKGLKASSALFRHEIAFVLGQLQNSQSIEVLTENLKDLGENEMVRHECAEALGAIGTKECEAILKEFLADEKRVVKESCEVALDICEYEMNGNFQYADGLQTILKQS